MTDRVRVTYGADQEVQAVEVEVKGAWVEATVGDEVPVADRGAANAGGCAPKPGYCYVIIGGHCYYYPC